jgi:flagellar assembly protein FliH
MSGVIKQAGEYMYISGSSPKPAMVRAKFGEVREIPVGFKSVNQPARQNNQDNPDNPAAKSIQRTQQGGFAQFKAFSEESFDLQNPASTATAAGGENDDIIRRRAECEAECEAIKQRYIAEGERLQAKAAAEAGNILSAARDEAERLTASARADIERSLSEAQEAGHKQGFEQGYSDGEKQGYDKGFAEGRAQCRDTLSELMNLNSELITEKENYFIQHERQLFDLVFQIASKVTEDSLKQKDKAVIQRLLKSGAKQFRSSKYVKVTLAQIDIELMGWTDTDMLKGLFAEGQNVEFEVLKDAPKGTVVLEDTSARQDLSVATQLEMIEKLGKGKFRNSSG